MEKIINRIKEYLKNNNNGEFVRNILVLLIIGVMVFILADIMGSGRNKEANIIKSVNDESYNNMPNDYTTVLERKLEDILSRLKGVGEVKVMITLEETEEVVPAFNTTKNNENTKETDSQGGTREIIREDMTIQVVTGDEGSPIVLKEIKPTIRGVIVIAEGADDLSVKEMLYEAVKTALGIPGNRVEVYSGK
ncbi:MAG TPA: sporulation stage III protein AG [Tissierellia bacterium]|nr:sporulation stage III protein AG [Tissierellia bacterium]